MALGIQNMLDKIRLLPQKDSNFVDLVENLLGLGLGGSNNTRSHVNHALGSVQEFLTTYPQHKQTIKNSSKTESFPITNHPNVLADWISFIQSQHGISSFNKLILLFNSTLRLNCFSFLNLDFSLSSCFCKVSSC